jgi:hypothetical protein
LPGRARLVTRCADDRSGKIGWRDDFENFEVAGAVDFPVSDHGSLKNTVALLNRTHALTFVLELRPAIDIAGFDDLIAFFTALPNADKQFSVIPGISHASFQQKNYMLVYHILRCFFCQPSPAFRGG